jgi:hypothetical protein
MIAASPSLPIKFLVQDFWSLYMLVSSKEADLALAEATARRELDEANKTNDIGLIRRRTVDLACAEKARREG